MEHVLCISVYFVFIPGLSFHYLSGTGFLRVFLHQDVDIPMDNGLATSHQCALVSNKNSGVLGCVKKRMDSRLRKVILPLYCAQYSRTDSLDQGRQGIPEGHKDDEGPGTPPF